VSRPYIFVLPVKKGGTAKPDFVPLVGMESFYFV
jgi:hypothetical protein